MTKRKSREWTPAKFVNYTLTKAETGRLKKFAADEWQGGNWLEKVVEEGYKVTFSYDDRVKCHCCWLIPQGSSETGNDGLILSGRGGTLVNAAIEAVFKHVRLFQGNWPSVTSDGSWTWDTEEEEEK